MEVLFRQSMRKLKSSVSLFILCLTVAGGGNLGVSYGAQPPQERVHLNVTNRKRRRSVQSFPDHGDGRLFDRRDRASADRLPELEEGAGVRERQASENGVRMPTSKLGDHSAEGGH